MILVRVPLRMSFVGGGSDLKAYYENRPGKVLSTAINKYVYVMAGPRFDGCIRVSYSKGETVDIIDEVEHDLVREALRLCNWKGGIEICYMGDFPIGRAGTGLGASSALAVGVLHALHALQGESVSREKLAEEACKIEIEVLKRPIGKQDQYAAALGGLNEIHFHADERVEARPVRVEDATKRALEENLLLFHTGLATESSVVLTEQKEKTKHNLHLLDRMVELVGEARAWLEKGHTQKIGELLHENWEHKKQLATKITNPAIEEMYEKAKKAGAIGGKILGSGGGGFLLLYAEPEHHAPIRNALKNLQEVQFKLEEEGSKILHEDTMESSKA